MAAIRAVSFDLWQTLIFDSPELERERSRLRLAGMERILSQARPVDQEALSQAYRRSGQALVEAQAREADMDTPEQVAFMLRCLPGDFAWALEEAEAFEGLLRAYVDPVLAVKPALGEGSREVLAWLKAQGYGVALISNTGRTPGCMVRRLLGELGILDSFDVLVFSNELGYTKPHPEIFRAALRELGVGAQEAAHVGDNPTTDLVGARKAGLRAVLLDSRGEGGPLLGVIPDACIREILGLKEVLARWRNG